MQAGVYKGPQVIKVEDWPVPQLEAGEVLVRVRYAGICGTDLLIHSGKHPRVVPSWPGTWRRRCSAQRRDSIGVFCRRRWRWRLW